MLSSGLVELSMHRRQRSHSQTRVASKTMSLRDCGVIQFRIAGFGNLRILVLLIPHVGKSKKGSGALAYSYLVVLLFPIPPFPSPGFQGPAMFTLQQAAGLAYFVKDGDQVRRSSPAA